MTGQSVVYSHRLGELAAVGDHDLLGGLAGGGTDALDGLDDVQTLGHGAEHDVLAVEPGGLHGAEEELGAVGVGARVGHGEDAGAGVLELEVLIREFGAVDGLSAGAVVVGEVSALAHEVGDDAVEGGALEAEALLAGAERAEVLCLGKFGVGDGFGQALVGGRSKRFLTAATVRPGKVREQGGNKDEGDAIWATGRTGGLGDDVRTELWTWEGG